MLVGDDASTLLIYKLSVSRFVSLFVCHRWTRLRHFLPHICVCVYVYVCFW